ncbi:hypothetical protein NHP194004_15750 [Helicobacter suis]|nr:hypothetical protein NHP194004_15750 [Helicobacter suis]
MYRVESACKLRLKASRLENKEALIERMNVLMVKVKKGEVVL